MQNFAVSGTSICAIAIRCLSVHRALKKNFTLRDRL